MPSGSPIPQESEACRNLDELVEKVANSETFRSAPAMRTLLLYLWHHRAEPVSQYAIAVDALDRPASFNPKFDSAVRVQIARLRGKLKEFYEKEGLSCPIRLSIPRGQHTLEWKYDDPGQVESSQPVSILLRYRLPIAIAVAAVALVGCGLLFWQNRSLRASMPDPLPRLWKAFLAGGKPATVVVPSPFFFFWNEPGFYLRELAVSDFSKWPSSPVLQAAVKEWGEPQAAPIYVGVMEMTAGLRLLQYLERRGQQVDMIESQKFSTESLGSTNTIFLGMPRTTTHLEPFLTRMNYYISRVSPDVVVSRNPKPGEIREFRQATQAVDRSTYPAIIAFLPARPEQKTRSMFLLGRILHGVTSILMSREGLAEIDEAWVNAGSPDAWEMVIEAQVFRDTVHRVRPVAFRSIAQDFWK